MRTTPRFFAVLAAAVMLAIAGCGSDDDDGGGADAKKAGQAKASGNVTWCIGKDTTGAFGTVVDNFNKANPDAKVKLLELPEAADEQRRLQIQRLRAKNTECDVLGADVIWIAEYAGQGWLLDVTDFMSENGDKFIKSTVDTTELDGKNYAVPFNSNAGFLFYRTDQVDKAPETWEEVYKEAKAGNGVVYQGFRYEGLTVNFLELLYSAGGNVLSEDGKEATADSQEVKDVLTFMADGIKDGAVPKAVTTYKEEESRRAFESGNATFMRNWPYAYALGKDSKIADKFDIATFPGFAGNKGAGVVGGYDLAISAYSKNPEGSLAFIEFATSADQQKLMATEASLPPTLTDVYDDPAVKKAMPFADDLRTAIEQAQPRPVSPVNPQISEAIFNNVYAALQGDMSPDEALEQDERGDPEGARDVLGTWKPQRRDWGAAGAASRGPTEARSGVSPCCSSRRRWWSSRWSPRIRSATRSGCRSPSTACTCPGSGASPASTTTPRRSARPSSGTRSRTRSCSRASPSPSSWRSGSAWRWRCTRRSRGAVCCARSCSCRGRCSRWSARSRGGRCSSPSSGSRRRSWTRSGSAATSSGSASRATRWR